MEGGGSGGEEPANFEELYNINLMASELRRCKSKSSTCLSDAASCSSLKDIVKPESAYARKQKNEIAHNNSFVRNCNFISRGMYKKPTNSRSSLALATTISEQRKH